MKRFMMVLSTAAVLMGSSIAAWAGSAYFVLDAKTGKVLASDNADAANHPASLTKMMTLYLTFEAIRRGKLSWDSKVPVSRNAAGKSPTKLGLKAGSKITVREAVNGMIIKSANDAATVMGEALGGSESGFGRIMTQKARQLGMSRTVFVNPSGLPNMQQVTSARDMSTLAVALMNDFPREYRLFSQTGFSYRGRYIHGHNNLMYRYQGMDGIKTGYTNASGFNIVSAVRQGNRRVIGVVLGGATARSRDQKMAALLDRYVRQASPTATARLVASVGGRARTVEVASASDDGDIPVPATTHRADEDAGAVVATTDVVPLDRPAAMEEIRNAGKLDITADADAPDAGRWQVQIAAAPSAKAAKDLLAKAKSRTGGPLLKVSPYTEAVGQGSSTLYRARFVGFGSRNAAASACDALKRHDFDCLLLPSQG